VADSEELLQHFLEENHGRRQSEEPVCNRNCWARLARYYECFRVPFPPENSKLCSQYIKIGIYYVITEGLSAPSLAINVSI
jgi:hypothetical protein